MSDEQPVVAENGAPPSRGTPQRADAVAIVGFAIAGTLVAFLGYAAISAGCLVALPSTPRLALALAQGLGLLLPAILLVAAGRALGGLAPLPAPRRAGPGVALGLAVWTFVTGLLTGIAWQSGLALVAPSFLTKAQRQLEQLYGPIFEVGSPWDILTILAALSLAPAVCEEALFRGFLQRALRSRATPAVAVGVTSTIFSVLHLDVIGLPTRILVGIAVGLAYERTGSLVLPCIVHATHNLLSLLVIPWSLEEALAVPTRAEALLGLGAAVPLIGAAWAWRRALRRLPAPADQP